MTSPSPADHAEPASRPSPQLRGRRRPALRRIWHVVLFLGLAAGVFGLLPRLGGLAHDAAGLRHGHPAFMVAAVVAQAASLGCYALLYRQVLAAFGARLRFRLVVDVVLASFLVSHVIPFGSAAGSVVNVDTLEKDGIAATTTGEAIALTSLVSTVALIALFGAGFAATAGRHLPQAYLVTVGIALAGSRRRSPPCSAWARTPPWPGGPEAGPPGWPAVSGRVSTRRRWPPPAAGWPRWPGPR